MCAPSSRPIKTEYDPHQDRGACESNPAVGGDGAAQKKPRRCWSEPVKELAQEPAVSDRRVSTPSRAGAGQPCPGRHRRAAAGLPQPHRRADEQPGRAGDGCDDRHAALPGCAWRRVWLCGDRFRSCSFWGGGLRALSDRPELEIGTGSGSVQKLELSRVHAAAAALPNEFPPATRRPRHKWLTSPACKPNDEKGQSKKIFQLRLNEWAASSNMLLHLLQGRCTTVWRTSWRRSYRRHLRISCWPRRRRYQMRCASRYEP